MRDTKISVLSIFYDQRMICRVPQSSCCASSSQPNPETKRRRNGWDKKDNLLLSMGGSSVLTSHVRFSMTGDIPTREKVNTNSQLSPGTKSAICMRSANGFAQQVSWKKAHDPLIKTVSGGVISTKLDWVRRRKASPRVLVWTTMANVLARDEDAGGWMVVFVSKKCFFTFPTSSPT